MDVQDPQPTHRSLLSLGIHRIWGVNRIRAAHARHSIEWRREIEREKSAKMTLDRGRELPRACCCLVSFQYCVSVLRRSSVAFQCRLQFPRFRVCTRMKFLSGRSYKKRLQISTTVETGWLSLSLYILFVGCQMVYCSLDN